MKKSDLAKLVGEDIGYWEIMNVSYEYSSKKLYLLLQEYEWKGCMFARDYKQYLGNIKRITMLDEFAFEYYEDDKKINAIEKYIESNNGLNCDHIKRIFNNPESLPTTQIQSEWIHILQCLNIFDKEKYSQQFLKEFKQRLKKYCEENADQKKLKDVMEFFEDVAQSFKVKKVD